jgi:hypothetical protein
VIGRAAKSLPLQPDSGLSSDHHRSINRGSLLIPTRSTGGTPTVHWKKLGRVGGYALDYGLGASGGAGVTEVYTNVDKYKSSDDAEGGLITWQSEDGLPLWLGPPAGGGLAGTIKVPKVAPVGSNSFDVLVSYSAANIAPVFGLDEQFTEGRYEADVTVWAGSAAAAKKLAPTLAKKLYARIKLARAGKLHAKPVKLPPPPQAGPIPGGPDLTKLALQPSDFGVFGSPGGSYFIPPLDPTALSAYFVATCLPLRTCGDVGTQDIEWCPSANQANFVADLWAAEYHGWPSVDLSGVGDGAQGFFVGDGSGAIVFSSGPLMEWIQDSGGVQSTADVQKLAQTAANLINAAGLGN